MPLFALHAIGLAIAGRVCGVARLVALALAGVAVAPLASLAGRHVDARVPEHRAAETLALAAAALVVGTGIGQAAAAALLDGARTASRVITLAAGPGGVAAGVLTFRRRPQPSPPRPIN